MAMSGTTKFLVVIGVAAVTIAGMGFGLNALSGGYAENVAATEIAPLVDEVAGDDGRVVCELGDAGTTDFLSANNIPWAQRAIVVADTAELDDRVIRVAADAGYDLAEVPESTADQHILEGTTDGVTLTVGVLRVGDWDAGCGAIDLGDDEAVVQMTIDYPPTS